MIQLKLGLDDVAVKPMFDLKEPCYSYMIGFIQADGCLLEFTRNRGRLSIELSSIDILLLEQFQKIIHVNSTITTRIRNTNFKKNAKSVCLNVWHIRFRKTLNYYGVPYGKKSDTIAPPLHDYSELDYWRGIIDGDGSVGFTKTNKPYISLVTSSDKLFKSYTEFIYKYTGLLHKSKRNKRDNVYNIIDFNEDAKKIVGLLYYSECLSLSRKYKISKQIYNWKTSDKIKL